MISVIFSVCYISKNSPVLIGTGHTLIMVFCAKAKIVDKEKIERGYWRLRLSGCGDIAGKSMPGQFLHILCQDFSKKSCDKKSPILRRPISIHRILAPDIIEILFKVVGQGTCLLSQKEIGQPLDILGPIGNGFKIARGKEALLVAGGIGIAPLYALAESLRRGGEDVCLFMGGKTSEDILCKDELRNLGIEVKIATDDGSLGHHGLVTDLLPTTHPLPTLYACGPQNMLKEVAKIAKKRGALCQVLLEERMACGIGACMSCVCPTKEGKYVRVCVDGPVFDAEEVDWE